MTWAEGERAELVRTLRATDPAAPTLCEGWTAHRLLAHLVLREHRPDLMARDIRATPGAEPQLDRLVSGSDAPAYGDLVDRFAAGPPAWSPFRWAPELTNLVEYVVHHEDVRRAGAEAEPRALPDAMNRALWDRLVPMARLTFRRSPVGIVLVVPGGPRQVVRRRTDAVALLGSPVELALSVLGRQRAADVTILGRQATQEAFTAFHG